MDRSFPAPPAWFAALRSALLPALLAASAGCGSTFARTPIVVPPEAVREWAWQPDGQNGPGRYVIRMTDGQREWEVEFPDAAYGSEVRVPLRGGGSVRTGTSSAAPTAADREIDEERSKSRQALHGEEPGFVDIVPSGAAPRGGARSPSTASGAEPRRKQKGSYLVGVAQVRDLYASRNYEIALVQLVDLERDYPNDEKLLAMKGSIYRRLGRTRLARETWERVLMLYPDNTVVASALRELAEEEERAGRRPRSGSAGAEGTPDEPGDSQPVEERH